MIRKQAPRQGSDEALVLSVQKMAWKFFATHAHPKTGLVLDSTQPGGPGSIAAVGFALSCYPVAVERGLIARDVALSHTLAALRFFDGADQTGAVDGTGFKGFFYHFLHSDTGRRAGKSELSTIDTALLLAGMLVAAQYFTDGSASEREVRERAQAIYARVDWRWAQNGGSGVSMGWKPETGFIANRWLGYNEALLLYVLALGAPEFSVDPDAYAAWTSTFQWRRLYGQPLLYAGPLFIHQFSHIWLDLRGIQDAFMAARKSDYFQNSRHATYIHQQYAIRNPRKYDGYQDNCWGFTASDGPGEASLRIKGRKREFHGYLARGAPFGPDDGTISPWAGIASLPFAPEIVIPLMRNLKELLGYHPDGMGFHASCNRTYPQQGPPPGWVAPWHYALNQGPIVLMVENYCSGLVWRLMRECPPIRLGLNRADFSQGWLAREVHG